MSLHDVSKDDNKRLDPKANASDARAQRDATNTTSIHPVTDATTTKGFLQTGSGRIVGNDGANNVGLFGFDSTGTMVVKVAKAGFDADTAAASNLIFNSSQNVFKILQTGTATIPVVVAAASGSSAYNFISVDTGISTSNSSPAILAYGSRPDVPLLAKDVFPLPVTNTMAGPGFGGYISNTWSTRIDGQGSTYIAYFEGYNYSNSATIQLKVRYYILQETAI